MVSYLIFGPKAGTEDLTGQTWTRTLRSTALSQVEKQKLQNHVPAGLVRALDIEIRNSKDPTLQTLSDGIAYCLELGVAELAKKNASDEGQYIAELFSRLRRMELEDRVREAEFKTAGWQPRNLTQKPGTLRVIREDKDG